MQISLGKRYISKASQASSKLKSIIIMVYMKVIRKNLLKSQQVVKRRQKHAIMFIINSQQCKCMILMLFYVMCERQIDHKYFHIKRRTFKPIKKLHSEEKLNGKSVNMKEKKYLYFN